MNLDLGHYTPEHRLELRQLLDSPPWREALRSGLVQQAREQRIAPRPTLNFIDTVVDQLLALNAARVRSRAAAGCRDADALLDDLARWPNRLNERDPRLSFVGLNLTDACNVNPRCIYCNQPDMDRRLRLENWKRIIEQVTDPADDHGPYLYLTGGEPLMLGEALWGDDGLIRYATARGALVNVNTNAIAITPQVALAFVKSGLGRLHISLDTADRDLQNALYGGGDCYDHILEGIYNVQLARELTGASYPVIHTNCVLTNRNLDRFPELLTFILSKHTQAPNKQDPFFNDLFPHIIPVGGRSNDALRPTAEEFARFYGPIWEQACAIWDRYQAQIGIPADQRGELFGFFSNPFLRVKHRGGLEAYVQASAEGRYGKLALARHCYVAPTQASFTPDGRQYRCGSHAIRHIAPLGDADGASVYERIRAGIASLIRFPNEEDCHGCALATLYINQAVETKLQEAVTEMLADALRLPTD